MAETTRARHLRYAVENQEAAARLHAASHSVRHRDRAILQDVSAAYYRAAREHLCAALTEREPVFSGWHYSFTADGSTGRSAADHLYDEGPCTVATYGVDRGRVSDDDPGECRDASYCVRLFVH